MALPRINVTGAMDIKLQIITKSLYRDSVSNFKVLNGDVKKYKWSNRFITHYYNFKFCFICGVMHNGDEDFVMFCEPRLDHTPTIQIILL